MIRAIAYPVMLIAGLGLIVSFSLHLASFHAGPELAKRAIPILFPGVFVVWLPTILVANRLTRDFKQRDFWNAALRGCPAWMRKGQWVIWGYVFFVSFGLPFLLVGRNLGSSPDAFVIFPAVFYSSSFCVMYSALHVEQVDTGRKCLNGHRIGPLAKFCDECGAPAMPDNVERPTPI